MLSSTWAWARQEPVELDRGACLVGELAPVAVLQRREQRGLRAGVPRFSPHDHSCPGGILGQVAQVGDLGDRGSFAELAVLSDRGSPPLVVDFDRGDRTLNLGGFAGYDREADVAVPASLDEPS